MPGVVHTGESEERGRVLKSHSFSGGERNRFFLNGAGRTYTDLSGVSGLDSIADSRGFALIDYDRDGWMDLVVVNSNEPQLQLFS